MSNIEPLVRELETAEAFHPDFELLARVAERSADAIDREIVETHAGDCVECRAELEDLRVYALASSSGSSEFLGVPRGGSAGAWGSGSSSAEELRGTPRNPRSRILVWAAAIALIFTTLWLADRPQARTLTIPKLATDLAANERLLRGHPRAQRDVGPLSPVGTMVLEDRPSFTWSGVRNATYRVEVFDEQFHPIVSSPELSTNAWTPPRRLPGGRTYVWQITANLGGDTVTVPQPPAPEARFHVIDRQRVRAIEQLQQEEGRPSIDLGVAYAEAGALAEAQREFSALVAANRQAELARTYLATVQAHTQ